MRTTIFCSISVNTCRYLAPTLTVYLGCRLTCGLVCMRLCGYVQVKMSMCAVEDGRLSIGAAWPSTRSLSVLHTKRKFTIIKKKIFLLWGKKGNVVKLAELQL